MEWIRDTDPDKRVHITYHVNGDARELPFVVGIVADLSGNSELPRTAYRQRRFVEIAQDNFDRVLKSISPALSLVVPDVISAQQTELSLKLRFASLDDFEPENVAMQIPHLRELLRAQERLANLGNNLTSRLENTLLTVSRDEARVRSILNEINGGEYGPAGELDRVAAVGNAQTPYESEMMKQWLSEFFVELFRGDILPAQDVRSMIDLRVRQLDGLLSRQLTHILHSPPFRELEATWRGLEFLVSRTVSSPLLKIKVLNASKSELARDLQRATEFDRSMIFDKVYNEEFDMLGGEPYGTMVCAFFVGREPDDIEFVERLSKIAAASHCPFILGAKPELLNCRSFVELSGPHSISPALSTDIYRRWNNFRDSEDSRFVGLVVPRILLRAPYADQRLGVGTFRYHERKEEFSHDKFLWGNAAFAFAVRLVEAFHKYGWCAAIRGVESGGLVSGLPVADVIGDDGTEGQLCPTEIALSDRRESELSMLGFIPLCHQKGSDSAVFFRAQSCNRPRDEGGTGAIAIARSSAQLEYTMAVSRFAHYLRAIVRDKVEGLTTAEKCEQYLQEWISEYVDEKDDPGGLGRPDRPLRSGKVTVSELLGQAGFYEVVAFLQPRFQLQRLAVPLRLVARVHMGGVLLYSSRL